MDYEREYKRLVAELTELSIKGNEQLISAAENAKTDKRETIKYDKKEKQTQIYMD